MPNFDDGRLNAFSPKQKVSMTYKMVERLHHIKDIELLISYVDPHDNDLLPINNDDNFVRALSTAKPLLRLIIQRKGMSLWHIVPSY